MPLGGEARIQTGWLIRQRSLNYVEDGTSHALHNHLPSSNTSCILCWREIPRHYSINVSFLSWNIFERNSFDMSPSGSSSTRRCYIPAQCKPCLNRYHFGFHVS